MGKQLDEFPSRPNLGRPHGSKYDAWLDGSIWELTKGIDFDSDPKAFVRGMRQHANTRRGLGLKALVESNNMTVIVQAVPKRKRS